MSINIPYKYAYLIGSLYFLVVWLVLFFRMKDKRINMLKIGFVWMWIGVMCEYLWWLRDWWRPQNITGTFIGIEDFIVSFTHFNVTIFIYKYVFKKDSFSNGNIDKRGTMIRFFIIMALIFGPSFTFYYLFTIPSYIATGIGILIAGIFIASKRKDLIIPCIWTTLLFFIVTSIMFLLGKLTYPDVILRFWYPETSRIIFTGYPLIDFIWYLILGFLMGGVYEYIFNKKFTDSNNPSLKEDAYSLYLIGKKFIEGKKLN